MLLCLQVFYSQAGITALQRVNHALEKILLFLHIFLLPDRQLTKLWVGHAENALKVLFSQMNLCAR